MNFKLRFLYTNFNYTFPNITQAMPFPIRKLLEASIKGKIIDTKMGASGIVYIVDNGENVHPRRIAFKTFRERFVLDEIKKQHFLEECVKWLKLRNHYIVTPFYPLVIAGQPFMCMPYCTTDLRTMIQERTFTNKEALVLATQLLKSMLSIEKRGMGQHQDLNPPNIMLLDLRERFPAYPNENMLNFEVRIADFGMLNLYNSLGPTKGAVGGKFPFKAPEQYSREERSRTCKDFVRYESFVPDTFSLGVILYMLFTGIHPIGMPANRALQRNTSGSIFRQWALSHPTIKMEDADLQLIINGCLQENPSQRPSLEMILNWCVAKLKFKQLDRMDAYQPRAEYLRTLGNIAELPGQRKPIVDFLIEEIQKQDNNIEGPTDVVYYGQIIHRLLTLIRKQDELDEYVIEVLYRLLNVIRIWHPQLRAYHLLPSLDEGKELEPVIPDLNDIEVAANFVSLAVDMLEKWQGVSIVYEKIRALNDPVLISLYYYHQAEVIRGNNIFETIKYLNMAKEFNPKEPLFDQMKQRWIKFAKNPFHEYTESEMLFLEKEEAKAADDLIGFPRTLGRLPHTATAKQKD
jgi:serine/threonine protein kinase